jgi:hypothetical protein
MIYFVLCISTGATYASLEMGEQLGHPLAGICS